MALAPRRELMLWLGWIPARGGSKGVPGKNKRMLGDKPLVVHTIHTARASGCFDRIVVSTDDPEIAGLASQAGAEVPWLRPEELATDEASVMDSLRYDLDRLRAERDYSPDGVMLLQPTSPFRTVDTVRSAAGMLDAGQSESVVSVSPSREHPYWCKRITPDGMLESFLAAAPTSTRRQDLVPVYVVNGVIYAAPAVVIASQRSFLGARTRALLISNEAESLDIDTPFDWLVAEAAWRHLHSGVPA